MIKPMDLGNNIKLMEHIMKEVWWKICRMEKGKRMFLIVTLTKESIIKDKSMAKGY